MELSSHIVPTHQRCIEQPKFASRSHEFTTAAERDHTDKRANTIVVSMTYLRLAKRPLSGSRCFVQSEARHLSEFLSSLRECYEGDTDVGASESVFEMI